MSSVSTQGSKLGLLGRAAVERNHGQVGAAAKAVDEFNSASRRIAERNAKMDQSGMDFDGFLLAIDDGLPFMSILVGADSERGWVSTETFDAVSDIGQLCDDAERWGPGMKYLVTEGGKYAEDAKRALKISKEVVPAKDPLTMIEEDANRLVVQAASMQDSPSESQLTLFAQRLADLRGRFEAVQAQHERTGDLINLAAVAISDALE